MKHRSSSSMGALHPILFLIMVYIISIVLAFFVCTTIYKSLHGASEIAEKNIHKIEGLTVLK